MTACSFWVTWGPRWAYVGPMLAYVEPLLGQERRVLLGLDFKAQKNTLFLGHVGAYLGLMLGQEQCVPLLA